MAMMLGIGTGLRYVGGRAPEWGNDWSDWLLATGRLAREIGWTLRRAYWSCGFATEAARAAMNHAFVT